MLYAPVGRRRASRSIAALGATAIELRLEGHDAHRAPGPETSPCDGGVYVRLTAMADGAQGVLSVRGHHLARSRKASAWKIILVQVGFSTDVSAGIFQGSARPREGPAHKLPSHG